jgi:hypothetical protein
VGRSKRHDDDGKTGWVNMGISAESVVNVPAGQARAWFLSLKDHPERYRFRTHEGFEFVRGDFGEIGAHFKTRERFYFLRAELLFELIEVRETSFRFKLIKPAWTDVWGVFSMQASGPEAVVLRLEIGSDNRWGRWWLKTPLVASAIGKQIAGEVAHIKESMESLRDG